MKKILSALCLVAAAAFTSCTDDYITVESGSSILMSDYFKSESRLYSGVVAAYDPLKWYDYFYQYNALNMVSDIMADDIYCGGSNDGDQPILVKVHYYKSTSIDCCNQIWSISYSGINRSNIVIEHADEVANLAKEKRDRYVSECMVLKCYYYNLLWKFWGNIPFYDKNLVAPYYTDQLTADQVYAKVIKILEDAIAMNALPMKASSGEEGRVTMAMAYMLYAEMVMYQNDQSRYGTALQYMKNICTSEKYSLVSDYASLWEESGEWSTETIWDINYISDGGVRDWGNPISTGGSVYPVLIGIPGCTKIYADGWGFSPVAKSAYDIYDSTDIRRDGGILDFSKFATATGATYTPRWQDTGYFLKKYIARVGGNHGYKGDPNMNHGNNQRIYRYAETLLNAAELSARTGADGSGYLSEVRTRAMCQSTGTSIDDIIEERHKEFVGEGKRYWDLVRTGKAATVLTAANHLYRTLDWTANKKYWPIPQSEIEKSDKNHPIIQNPY